MVAKICIILIFVGVVVGVGIYARQHTKNVDGFVLGGRNVGPWLFGVCFWHQLLFGGNLRWLRRSVRLEIRLGGVLDWHRQCPSWFAAGMVGAWSAYA